MPVGYNLAMHWGQGILPGAVHGLMAKEGVREPFRSFLFCNLRLLNDQTLENASGVGAPPWTWLVNEQVLDLVRKACTPSSQGWSPPGSSAALAPPVGRALCINCDSIPR
jgi:hypothetical protein